jgi:pimeloyl-ACP methyl ester carboxylesterase
LFPRWDGTSPALGGDRAALTVLGHLLRAGVAAEAVPNPLRGLTGDGEYIANLVGQIEGTVVLVGHSYGGPVITYASSRTSNVKALVFVASFGLDKGDTTRQRST